MNYLMLKHAHLTFVVVSFCLFNARFFLYASRQRPIPGWLKIVPHIVDSLLLASALGMAWLAGFTPGNSPWLLAKIIILLFYIAFAAVALRGRDTRRWYFFVAAWVCFAYIVVVAIQKNFWPIS